MKSEFYLLKMSIEVICVDIYYRLGKWYQNNNSFPITSHIYIKKVGSIMFDKCLAIPITYSNIPTY